MVASDITPLLVELKAYWAAMGIETATPATPEEVASFEERYRVRLPADFREYLLTLNGAVGGANAGTWDHSMTTFYSLADIQTLKEAWNGQGADGLFVIANHNHHAELLVIRLNADPAAPTPLHGVCGLPLFATSFTEFLTGYLADDCNMHWGLERPPDAPRAAAAARVAPRARAMMTSVSRRDRALALVGAVVTVALFVALAWIAR